jgi:hypothetical protein
MSALKMAIVNEEIDVNQGRLCSNATDCAYSMLSCRYLRYINNNIIQVDSFLLRFSLLIAWRNCYLIFNASGSL